VGGGTSSWKESFFAPQAWRFDLWRQTLTLKILKKYFDLLQDVLERKKDLLTTVRRFKRLTKKC